MQEKILHTIRETARLGLLSEFALRKMVKDGTLPGVFSGNRFLVNVPQLRELVDEMSRETTKGAV